MAPIHVISLHYQSNAIRNSLFELRRRLQVRMTILLQNDILLTFSSFKILISLSMLHFHTVCPRTKSLLVEVVIDGSCCSQHPSLVRCLLRHVFREIIIVCLLSEGLKSNKDYSLIQIQIQI